MATFQTLRNRHTKTRASVRKSFSEDVFQSVRSLLQSDKELCSVSAEDRAKQDGPVGVTEVTFLGFNEETDAAHIQDLAAVSLELPDLLNSLHFCSLNENEIICMKDINKSSAVNNGPVSQSRHSGMLCVMRVSPTLPRLRIDFIFGLLSKYATGIRYAMDTSLRQKRHLETTDEDDDDTSQSVSSIEDDFVTAFEHLEEEETSKPYNDGVGITAPESQGDAASQKAAAQRSEPHDLRILVGCGRQVLSAKPPTSLINILGHKERPVKTSVTTSISEPWIQRSFYRSSNAPDKGSGTQKTVLSSSPASSSESECSSPSPVIFLDEEGYQKSLKAKLELPKIPVTKDDIEDSDSEVSEFFDSFDQFDELEQILETSGPFLEDCVTGKPSQKKGQTHEEACSVATAMNPQKFKSDRPALPAHVRKPTPRKPESPHRSDAPDSPRPVTASAEDRGLFSPIRSSAFSPLGGSTPVECFCQTNAGGETIHEKHDSVYYTYEDYADSISCEVLGSVLHTRHTDATSNAVSARRGENKAITLKSGSLHQTSKARNASFTIKDSIQKFAADLVEKSFVGAFKDLQKGVSSCTHALCHLAVRLTTSVFQMAFDELRRQHAFSLQERALGGLANFLVSEALSSALKDLQYVRKQMLTNTAAGFAAGLAEELVFEGIMEVCQFSCPPTPASPPRRSSDYDQDQVVKSYAKDLSESVIQEAFIELSQVDVTFTAKAAFSVSTGSIKRVSAENFVPSTQTPTLAPASNSPAVMATKPAQACEKEYTVQQALFCTSGIVTSIPMPLAGSALLPFHFSANARQAKSHLSSGDSNLSGGSAEARVSTKNEEEGARLRNICLSSEHHPGNHGDLKPADDVVEVQSSSTLTRDPVILSTFSAAMVHTIVNETLESVTSFKDAKPVDEHTGCLTKTAKGKTFPYHQVTSQQSEASREDVFADQLSKFIIKHSIDKSKLVTSNIDKNVEHKEGWPVPGEASQKSTLEKCPKFPDAQGHLNHCSLSVGKAGAPERGGPAAHGFSLETPRRCPAAAGQRPDSKDKSVKRNHLNNTTPEPVSFGQESPFPHSHAFSSTVLTCVDGLHVEDKQKIRDGNVIPDTPPSTPLVPSQASSECDIKKLTKKLKGELAKEFAPATPPSTPRNSSGGNVSGNEQNAIEKEEFMLKLMRSLSEEVEGGEGGEHPGVDVTSEHPGKKVQFAEGLATRIVSLATETAASRPDDKVTQEPRVKSPCLNVQSQRSVSPAFPHHSGEDLQTLHNFAGHMAAEVVTEAEQIAKVRSCLLFKQRRGSCHVEGARDDRAEKLHVEAAAHPREDPFINLSLPSSRVSGLTYKYPSCESVTDEYAGHIIQVLKREGGNRELLVDQFASRLAYRSVRSGLQEAARAAGAKRSSQTPLAQSSGAKTSSGPSVFLQKDHHRDAGEKRQSPRSGGHLCTHQTCARARGPCRGECSELDGFSTSLARCIARDARRALAAPAGGRPPAAADSCRREQPGWPAGAESPAEPAFPGPLQPSLQSHGFYHRTGSAGGRGCGESIAPAGEVPSDTSELSLGSAVVRASEISKAVGGTTCASQLSPLVGQACGHCDHRELQDRGRSSAQHLFRPDVRSKPLSDSRLGHICQKSRIFHLDVPQIHVDLDKKTVLAEKIVAEAIERAERELSTASLAADSGIGQEAVSFAESLTADVVTAAMADVGRALSSPKEVEDFQSAESLGSQQMNLSIGDDSTGSWSNLSFEDEHQDESSSFHHLSESHGNSSSWSSLALEGDLCEDSFSFPASDSDGPDDKDEEHEDEIEGLEQDGKTLLITNIDMEPCTVDPQLRVILQWLVASEVEVAQLAFHDSAKKEFVRLSKHLQEKGWRVGDLLQAVLKYYDVAEKSRSEDMCRSLFDWLLENA